MHTPIPHTLVNRQWIYRRVPEGLVGPEHHELRTTRLDTELAEGEVLIAARYLSVDPYMRIQQALSQTWEAPHPLDTVQGGGAIAQVLGSRADGFVPGDWVSAYSGWQTHARVHHAELTRLDPAAAPVTTALGVLGMPGRTAWFGLMEAGRPRPGDVVLVSGAAGAVGSLVVQFARKAGARVLAIAGSADKCRWLVDTLGAEMAINYRDHHDSASLGAAIAAAVGQVDVYFDNVGGWISDAVLPLIALRARVVICGQISQYGGALDQPETGPRWMHHLLYQRASVQGILARDFAARMDEMRARVEPWVRAGEIHFEQSLLQGFEQLPSALQGLFTGVHRGKVLVQVE
ncbi:MAG: NADP-dependent oxidoreductase [Lysobacterales bacterium]